MPKFIPSYTDLFCEACIIDLERLQDAVEHCDQLNDIIVLQFVLYLEYELEVEGSKTKLIDELLGTEEKRNHYDRKN